MLLPITVEGKLRYPAHIYILFYDETISNPTCYTSFICAFYHACSSYRFSAITALPPLIGCANYFHTIAGFRTHETAVKKSYYKINHYMHRKTHLITQNGPPFITVIYISYPTIPSTKASGNQFNNIVSPIDKYIYASFHANGKIL